MAPTTRVREVFCTLLANQASYSRRALRSRPCNLVCLSTVVGLLLLFPVAALATPWDDHGALEVSANGRFLQHQDGTPFFWQADTAWGIFRNSFATATDDPASQPVALDDYFAARAQQGFNVVQAQLVPLTPRQSAVMVNGASVNSTNAYGARAFAGTDDNRNFSQPIIQNGINPNDNNDYWDYVAFVIKTAAAHGIYVAIVPAWNNHFVRDISTIEAVATNTTTAYNYGQFLGANFGTEPNVIWVLGGDANVNESEIDNTDYLAALRDMNSAMAEGITDGVDPSGASNQNGSANYDLTLMTLHPAPAPPTVGRSSKTLADYQVADWMDFDSIQSSITHDVLGNTTTPPTYVSVGSDYDLVGTNSSLLRPTADIEVSYEYSFRRFGSNLSQDDQVPISTWEARRSGYLSVFAGGHGYTYGHRNLIQFILDGQTGNNGANGVWFESLGIDLSNDQPTTGNANGEAANQIQFLSRLMLSRPFFNRVPAQALVDVGGQDVGHRYNRLQATRAADDSYAFIYSANGRTFSVDLGALGFSAFNAWWYNPRDGQVYDGSGNLMTGTPFIQCMTPTASTQQFNPPATPSPANNGLNSNSLNGSDFQDNSIGNDWVLVLDDANRNFRAPGDTTGPAISTCDTPNDPQAFQQSSSANNLLVIEAESFTTNTAQSIHSWNTDTSQNGFSGAAALRALPNTTPGTNNSSIPAAQASSPRLDYNVNFVAIGTHYVWVRGYARNTGEDSLHVGLNDGQPNVSNSGMRFPDTNQWAWSRDISSNGDATIEITSTGSQTLNVWMREDGFRFDKILLTTDPNFVPTGVGPAESPQGSAGPGNNPPTITSPGNQVGTEGDSVSLNVNASDPDGDSLTFSAANLPNNLAISGSSGLVTGTLTTSGSFNSVVTVTDTSGEAASTSFAWTVNSAQSTGFQQSTSSGNLLVVEAENADANIAQGAHSWTVFNAGAASNGASLEASPNIQTNQSADYAANSPQLDFTANFVATGTHYVWVRGFAPNGGADSVHIGLDNNELLSSRRVDEFDLGTWNWSELIQINSSTFQRATIEIDTTGTHTLNAWMREDGFRLDKILLTTDPNFIPTGIGPAESPR